MATTSTYNDQPIATHNDYTVASYESSQYGAALGRILFSAIFIISGLSHFRPEMIAYAASQGLPASGFLVPVSGLLIFLGGLSVAFGLKARWGALLIALFLIPVTLIMHNFWAYSDPVLWQMQFVNFLKNLGLFGAALLIMHFGSGPISIDSYMMRRGNL